MMEKIFLFVLCACLFQDSHSRLLPVRRHPTCGQTNYDSINQQTILPWLVKIIDNEGQFVSSGSLISDDVVLTSNDIDREGNLEYTVVAASGEEMGIRKVIAHGGDPRDWNNNLALVFLERNLRLGSKVDTVCLFSQNVTRDCFGYNVAHAFDSNDEEVRVFELTTMEAEQCKKVMNENDIVLESTEASICAIAESDANQGFINDWGSGLFCPQMEDIGEEENLRRFVQVGVFSWTLEGKDTPSGYTSVDFFSTWIKKTIKNNKNH